MPKVGATAPGAMRRRGAHCDSVGRTAAAWGQGRHSKLKPNVIPRRARPPTSSKILSFAAFTLSRSAAPGTARDKAAASLARHIALTRAAASACAQIKTLHSLYPRDQVLVLADTDLKERPNDAMHRVFAHMGLEPWDVSALTTDQLEAK